MNRKLTVHGVDIKEEKDARAIHSRIQGSLVSADDAC